MSKREIRTRFGFSAAALSTNWYGLDIVELEKAKMLEQHLKSVAADRPLPTDFRTVLVDRSGPHLDGIEFEWVSRIPEGAHPMHRRKGAK